MLLFLHDFNFWPSEIRSGATDRYFETDSFGDKWKMYTAIVSQQLQQFWRVWFKHVVTNFNTTFVIYHSKYNYCTNRFRFHVTHSRKIILGFIRINSTVRWSMSLYREGIFYVVFHNNLSTNRIIDLQFIC